jgi:uncharacterized cupin superfamily protein
MSCDTSAAFAAEYMTDALAVVLSTEPIAADQIASIEGAGHPETGATVLGHCDGREVGVWEMTPGAMTDVEVDELCIIISGSGEVHRTIDGKRVIQTLRPGSVLQLRDGEETVWVVTQTLRKVYLA